MAIGKRLKKAREGVDRETLYPLADAIKMVKERAKSKFDETIEIAINLGVDPRHADQMVRGVVNLPNGTGRTLRVGVFARGAKAEEAKAAGADVVGAEDLVEKVQGGNIDFETTASGFPLPVLPEVTLSDFKMKGQATPRGMAVNEWSGKILGGEVSGTAELRWAGGWGLDGVITARNVNAAPSTSDSTCTHATHNDRASSARPEAADVNPSTARVSRSRRCPSNTRPLSPAAGPTRSGVRVRT
jgi:hypothetical protein